MRLASQHISLNVKVFSLGGKNALRESYSPPIVNCNGYEKLELNVLAQEL